MGYLYAFIAGGVFIALIIDIKDLTEDNDKKAGRYGTQATYYQDTHYLNESGIPVLKESARAAKRAEATPIRGGTTRRD